MESEEPNVTLVPSDDAVVKLPMWPTFHLSCTTFLVAILIIATASYQGSILNVPVDILVQFENRSYFMHYGHYLNGLSSTTLWGVTVASSGVATLLGGLAIPFLTRRFGRRKTVVVGGGITVALGGLLEFLSFYAESFELFILGQMIGNGLGWALGYGLGVVYLTECSPTHLRGMIGTSINVGSCLGTVLAYVLALPELLGTPALWHWYAFVSTPPALLAVFLIQLAPESPKHLYMYRKEEDKARRSILKLYGPNYDHLIAFADFEEEMNFTSKQVTVRDMVQVYYLRQPLIIGCVTGAFGQVSGTLVILSYSVTIFQELQVSPHSAALLTIALAVPLLFFSLLSSVIVDRLGRRLLLLGGGLLLVVFLSFYVLAGAIHQYSSYKGGVMAWLAIGSIFANCWLSALGPSSVGCFLFAEILPQSAVSLATSFILVVNNVIYIGASMAFPPLQDLCGYWAVLVVLVLPSFLCLSYLYYFLPETRGLPVNDIVNIWVQEDLRRKAKNNNEANQLLTAEEIPNADGCDSDVAIVS